MKLPRMVYAGVLIAGLAVPMGIPRAAYAEAPSSDYNGPIQSVYDCIAPRSADSPVQMYASDGTDTGFRFNGIRWSGDDPCGPGELRISEFPPAQINGTTMYMQRGGGGTTDQDGSAIRHGFVRVGDLSRRPGEVTPSAPNGRSCASATDTLYYNAPSSIPGDLQYKPGETTSDWANYGDPAQDKGTYHPAGIHYDYLLWSWLTDGSGNSNPGGGQPRAVVMKNDRIRLCDVARIVSPAYAPGTSTVVGFVQGAYGRVTTQGGESLEGWLVEAWAATGQGGMHYEVSTTPVP